MILELIGTTRLLEPLIWLYYSLWKILLSRSIRVQLILLNITGAFIFIDLDILVSSSSWNNLNIITESLILTDFRFWIYFQITTEFLILDIFSVFLPSQTNLNMLLTFISIKLLVVPHQVQNLGDLPSGLNNYGDPPSCAKTFFDLLPVVKTSDDPPSGAILFVGF